MFHVHPLGKWSNLTCAKRYFSLVGWWKKTPFPDSSRDPKVVKFQGLKKRCPFGHQKVAFFVGAKPTGTVKESHGTWCISHDADMGMVYLPTWMSEFYGFHVGKYDIIHGSYGICICTCNICNYETSWSSSGIHVYIFALQGSQSDDVTTLERVH